MSDTLVASAFVFSGRPNPVWPVSDAVVRELQALWSSLATSSERPSASQVLGYRGCCITDEAGRVWHAYRGVVTLTAGNSSESRRDPERIFETRVLVSAPAGVLPVSLFDEAMRKKLDTGS